MKKRIIALVLGISMCISSLPMQVFANLQSPVQEVSENSTVRHATVGTGTNRGIRPVIDMKFKEPITSIVPDNSAQNGSDIHEAENYQVHLSEYPSGASFRAPTDPYQLKKSDINMDKGIPIHEYTDKLKNGKIYKITVVPYHLHSYIVDEENNKTEARWAPHLTPIATHPFQYVLTDFDTRVEGGESSIDVSWEDTGHKDMLYKIGYVQGNYEGESIDKIPPNNIEYITPSDIRENATRYLDPDTGQYRFKYTIKNNIATGQMYSAFVVSESLTLDGRNLIANWDTPKIATATTQIGLKVFNIGKDKIRLEWNAQLPHLMDGSYSLEQTIIKEYAPGDKSGRVIATLHKKAGADLGYYEYREPKENTHYQLVFIYKNAEGSQLTPEPQTPKVLYVPGELRVKPLTPQIPKPIGPNTLVTDANKHNYLLPNDQVVDTTLNELWKSDHTFHPNMSKPPKINLVWSAYNHIMESGNKEVDLSILYDIWVSDDMSVVNTPTAPLIQNLSFYGGQNENNILHNQENNNIVGFKYEVGEYLTSNMRKLPLTPNKVYYIKVVAKKQYGDEFEESLPVITTIMFNGDGEVFTPPMISKPPLKLKEDSLGKTSVTISWLESWYEILAKNPDDYENEKENIRAKRWNAKVYTGNTTGPAISFVKNDINTEHILKTERDLKRLKQIVADKKGNEYYGANYIDRPVNLGKNVKYEYKVIPYETILTGLEEYNKQTINKLDIEEYIEMLMKQESESGQGQGWKSVTPKTSQDGDYVEWKEITENNLKPNTSYVFFVKPYSHDYDGSKLQSIIPTWIVVTTLPDSDTPEGTPTVPNLALHGKSDSEISVTWEYNSNFDYEIRYSRLEDPDKATVWPFEISNNIDDPNYVPNGGKAIETIKGLFPDTNYHIWIRAKQKKGNKISAWSNPVSTKTDILGKPTSPPGLGIASYQSILEAGKDFQPVGDNYLTVEWERLPQDKDLDLSNQSNQRVQKEYKYVIELADNPEFLDVKRVVVGKDDVGKAEDGYEILSRTMVAFDGLIANRPYYVRAKTLLIAHDTENKRDITMESEYTQIIRIITKASQDEYDGEDKSNEVIYPEKIKEDYSNDTWTYEVLDTQTVITEVVKGDKYKYIISMDKYRGRYNPKYRVIRLPQPLVKALINRRMELEIRTNILSIKIPANALESYMLNTNTSDILELKFTTLLPSDLYATNMPSSNILISMPENLSINLRGKSAKGPLTSIDELVKISIHMPNKIDYFNQNLGGYTYDNHLGTWKKGNHTFDKINMRLEYTSKSIGTYAAYQVASLPAFTNTVNQSTRNVLNKYNILGIGSKYVGNMKVGSKEYVNIILGIAENKETIAPDMGPTQMELSRAQKSGIFTGSLNSGLTQEAAISGIVRLYEMKQGIAIRPYTNSDVSSISRPYKDNINKAYSIGLIDYINPRAYITYNELFELIEQVIE